MQNIADKADSTAGATGELTATEYNSHKNELQGAVTRSGQTLSAATLLQLAKALFINGVGAESCVDSGSGNSIILSPATGASGLVVPDNYSELEGAILSFTKADINTSTAVTVNFGQTGTELGAKSLVRIDETVPAVGDVIGRCLVQWDNSADKWVLISNETDTYKYDVSSAGGALAPKFSNNIAEVDASLGNVSITLADPEFVGQRIRIFANGTGIVDVAGTGLYANNVYITENTGGMSAEAVEVSGAYEWRADNGVTADYVSGGQRAVFYGNGLVDLYEEILTTTTSSVIRTVTLTFIITLVDIGYIPNGQLENQIGGSFPFFLYRASKATTTCIFGFANRDDVAVTGAATAQIGIAKGYYA